ncbi:hypothetical protein SAY86_031181 [Trapa natans]|uniref:Leucine-rich repeat-containing N-terminal plant-type domain-containing protein n=1 Tax=Trapa natans TaxID=22666 RepID=A0AAN7LLH6_TRANT|nr:hypothetical protein SAY86_031181 [Trapa natans]
MEHDHYQQATKQHDKHYSKQTVKERKKGDEKQKPKLSRRYFDHLFSSPISTSLDSHWLQIPTPTAYSHMRKKMGLWVLLLAALSASLSIIEGKVFGLDGFSCDPDDLKGLTSFRANILLDTSERLANWTGRNCCDWEGISCDNMTGRVTGVSLPGFISTGDSLLQSQMKGVMSPSITLLSSLEVVDFGGLIDLSGVIPSSIGFDLPNLRKIYLFGNRITGPIPDSIGKLLKLEELALFENRLSGAVPSSLGNLENLNSLLLYSNQLSGEVPGSLANLTRLVHVDIHGNFLSGAIHESIGQLQNLKDLDLSNNLLNGKIPISICNLTAISVLYLDANSLEGPIPSCLHEMSSLGFLRLQNNHLTGNIPPVFGNLVSLQRVSLANNVLTGEIPVSIGNLSALTEMYLEGNLLSGQLPSSLGHLGGLLVLNVSHNAIQGPLPQEISFLQNLQVLDLSYNMLNLSSVPEWISQLPSLSRIYMAACGIEGEIPRLFQTMSSPIQELDLSNNFITGSLPSWIGGLAQLYMLDLSRNSLVSYLPETLAGLGSLGVLDLHSNKLEGSIQHVVSGASTYIDLSDNNFTEGTEELGSGIECEIRYLNLSFNSLKGKLPSSLGRCTAMQILDLSNNNLGFDLPIDMANISSLEKLKLQKNHLTGYIPKDYLRLTKLQELDLSDNLLVGEIPAGKPLSDFPVSSFSGNKGLCGKPLPPCKF